MGEPLADRSHLASLQARSGTRFQLQPVVVWLERSHSGSSGRQMRRRMSGERSPIAAEYDRVRAAEHREI